MNSTSETCAHTDDVCAQSLSHVQLFSIMDCSPPGSPVHGILQARILEWVAISFSGGSSPPRNRTWGLWHCEKWKWKSFSHVWLFATPWTIGVGNLSLLQGIFPTQGSNPGLPYCRRSLSQLSHKGSPRILEWVAYPFSSGSSQPGNQTGVSCITGGFFTNWELWGKPAL